MSYEALTQDQQESIDGLLQLLRPGLGQAAKLLHTAKLTLDAYAIDGQAALAALQDADEIPNKTGLAGAKPLTKAEIESLMTGLQTLVDTYASETHRRLHIKAAGVNAML